MPTCYHCSFESTPGGMIDHIVAKRHRESEIRKWAKELCAYLQTAPTAALLFKHMTWTIVDCGAIVYVSAPATEWVFDSELAVLPDFDSTRAEYELSGDGDAGSFGDLLEFNPVWATEPEEPRWGIATWMVVGYFCVLAGLDIDKFETYIDLVLTADSYWKPYFPERKIALNF